VLEISDGECSAEEEWISTTVSIKHSKHSQAHLIYTHRSLAMSRRRQRKRRLCYRHIEASPEFPLITSLRKLLVKTRIEGEWTSVMPYGDAGMERS